MAFVSRFHQFSTSNNENPSHTHLTGASNSGKGKNFEYVSFQRNLLNKLGYFGISTTRIFDDGPNIGNHYLLARNTGFGIFMYWILHLNVTVKAIFLAFLITDYFGPVEFLDKIASLDYILCCGLVVVGAFIFLERYPFYEILQATWVLLNSIYSKHGCPVKVRSHVNRLHRNILLTHLVIIFGGCAALMIQYFPDPKYCNFTYSTFALDTAFLRGLFGLHEFCFMMMAWNGYAGPSSLCMYQGVAISAIIDRMNETLQLLYRDEMRIERTVQSGRGYRFRIRRDLLQPRKVVPDTEYDIDKLLFDYRQLMLICNQFNDSVSYKTLYLHICGGSQFVSDVFAATHVLKLPGTGFMDVWFYIWDSMSAGFMLLRVYHFMGLVSDASETFLATLKEYMTFPNSRRMNLRKVVKTLKVVSLNVGPIAVYPESVLAVLDTMGNYYVCAALW